MRSPNPSFRSELSTYQRRLLDLQKTAPPDAAEWFQLAIELVNQWLDRPDAESMWNTIQSHLSPAFSFAPRDFIDGVVQGRFFAEELMRVIRDLPAVEHKNRQRTKRHLAKSDYASLASENVLLASVKDQRSRLLSREVSAPRTRFMRNWCDHFRQLCDQPLYEVVCAITQIAFDDDSVTIEAVRGAHRPSTRAGRRRRYDRDTQPPK